jgi:hypothetical protein
MKKNTFEKKEQELLNRLEEVWSDLHDVALTLVDDLEFVDDLGDNISCFLDKGLYEEYQSFNVEHAKLWDKLKKLRAKQKESK